MAEEKFSDSQIALLEQLTYIDDEVLAAAGIKDKKLLSIKEGMKIEDILKEFDDKQIELLREKGDKKIGGACISGEEWASIIETLQHDSDLADLKVVRCDQNKAGTANMYVCYEDTKTGQGIITFKGTTGYKEWYDNCDGLTKEETECQVEAQKFYKEVAGQFDDIIVAGHSKGANKAMFVTITADDGKISRCIAFDGPGFSNEFLKKYADKIEKNGEKIINYALSVDFVHGLMKQVPNAAMVYVQGYGLSDATNYHSPNSFFVTDDDGNIQLQNGEPQFEQVDENENIKQIHGFLTYIMDAYSKKDLEEMGDFAGHILGYSLGGGEDGAEKAKEYFYNNKDKVKKLVSMIKVYGQVNNLSQEDLDGFIKTFGIGIGQSMIAELVCAAVHDEENIDTLFDMNEAVEEHGMMFAGPELAQGGYNIYGNIVGEVSDDAAENVAQTGQSVGTNVGIVGTIPGIVGDIIGQQTGGMTGSIIETVGDGTASANQAVGEFIIDASESVGDTIDAAGDVLETLYHSAGEFWGDVAEGMQDVGTTVGQHIAENAEEIVDCAIPFVGLTTYNPFLYGDVMGKTLIKPEADNQMQTNRRMSTHH